MAARPAREQLTVLVSGMVAGDPHQGGASWAILQYLLGLRDLGHRAVLVEPIDRGQLGDSDLAASVSARYFRDITDAFGIEGALVASGSTETVGLSYAEVARIAGGADLLLNVAGMLTDPELLEAPRRRAYLDLDPAFVQLWHAVDGIDMRFAAHERHVTVGLRVGDPTCAVPTCGLDWHRTPPCVALSHWPVAGSVTTDAFTTIGNWRGYGSIEHGGMHYGQRAHSMRALAGLPAHVDERLAPALAIHPDEVDDLALLREHGWELLDPAAVAATPEDYRRFVQGSKAELGIAKSGYVVSRCGWFSDRSACYLASGRPVVAQDTGFGDALPVGEGLLAYDDIASAAEAIRRVTADYARHRQAARAIAEDQLATSVVLPRLLDAVLG